VEENQEEITLAKKKKRRKKDNRVAILPTLGFFAPLLFGKAYGGTWSSPMEAMKDGKFMLALQSAIINLTGLGIPMPDTGYTSGEVKFDIGKVLNPTEFGHAGALKGLLFGTAGSKAATKFGLNRQLKKVPFVGKYIKL